MFEGRIQEIEMDAFDQQIGRDHSLLSEVIDHGCVITHPQDGGSIL